MLIGSGIVTVVYMACSLLKYKRRAIICISYIPPIFDHVRLRRQVEKKWRKSGENKVEKILIFICCGDSE